MLVLLSGLIAIASILSCKNTPDSPPAEQAVDPLNKTVHPQVREVLFSEDAHIIARLDPGAYERIQPILERAFAPYQSLSPQVTNLLRPDIWRNIGEATLGFETARISREDAAYMVFGLGERRSLGACLTMTVPCPFQTIGAAATATFLLPSKTPELLESDVVAYLDRVGSPYVTQVLGDRYLKVDLAIIEHPLPTPIDYGSAPRRARTTGFHQALGEGGALNVFVDAQGMAMVGLALQQVSMYETIQYANPKMSGVLATRLLYDFADVFSVWNPDLTEYSDAALSLREEEAQAHLDVVMSRTPLGADIARSARGEAPVSKIAADGALAMLELQYNLAQALMTAQTDGHATPARRLQGTGSTIMVLTRPVSLLKPLLLDLFEQRGDLPMQSARVAILPGTTSPIRVAAAIRLIIEEGTRNMIDAFEQAAQSEPNLSVSSPREDGVTEAQIFLGEGVSQASLRPPSEPAGLRLRVDLSKVPEVLRAAGTGGFASVGGELISKLGRVEVVSSERDEALVWRLTLGTYDAEPTLFAPVAPRAQEPLCARAEALAMQKVYREMGKRTARGGALTIEEEALARAVDAYDAALVACAEEHKARAAHYRRQRGALALFAGALFATQQKNRAVFEEARKSACADGFEAACDEETAERVLLLLGASDLPRVRPQGQAPAPERAPEEIPPARK